VKNIENVQKEAISEICPHKPVIGSEFIEQHKDSGKLAERSGKDWFVKVNHKSVSDHEARREHEQQV